MLFGIVGIYMQQTKEMKNELHIYEALYIFSKIDDITHEQFAEMQASGNPHGFTGVGEYLAIDS